MTTIKHTMKCRKCGHVYVTKTCDLADSQTICEPCLWNKHSCAIRRQLCPICLVVIKNDDPMMLLLKSMLKRCNRTFIYCDDIFGELKAAALSPCTKSITCYRTVPVVAHC